VWGAEGERIGSVVGCSTPVFGLSFPLGFQYPDARRHVNKLCAAAGVPLIESGTQGYLGQVTPIMKVRGCEGHTLRLRPVRPSRWIEVAKPLNPHATPRTARNASTVYLKIHQRHFLFVLLELRRVSLFIVSFGRRVICSGEWGVSFLF
jgi:hypothetical protein